MQRDTAYLLDILDSARLVLSYVSGKSREEFLSSVGLQDQVIRRLEIMGEAARRVTEETRLGLSSVPWNEMVGLRNILIHEYGEVNLELLWDLIHGGLRNLI